MIPFPTILKITLIVFSSILKPIQNLSIETPAIYLSVAEDNFSDQDIDLSQFNFNSRNMTVAQDNAKGLVMTTGTGQASSIFLNQQLATDANRPGFSTYFVMNTYRTSPTPADGYVFIIAANANALGESGGGLGYTGIRDSVGIEFDFYDNGGENIASTDVFTNGVITTTPGTVFDSGYMVKHNNTFNGSIIRAFHTWIEYNSQTSTLEVRVALSDNENATTNRPDRPANALLTRTISLPQISTFFYAGFTAATGGAAQGMSLKSWYIANQFITGGIQPNLQNIVVDNVVPTSPTITTSEVQDQYQMTISGGTDNEPRGIAAYQYRLPNGAWQSYDAEVAMTTAGTYQARSVDYAGNFSAPSEATLSWIIFVVNGVEMERLLRLANPDVPYPINQTYNLIGYAVDTWYLNANFDNDPVDEVILGNTSVTLYGKRDPLSFSLSYTLNGGVNADNPTSYTIETSTFALNTPTREGYSFAGWYDNADFNGNVIENITLGSAGNINLFAKWQINAYTLTFDSQGGTAVGSITQDYATVVSAPNPPTKTGYTFVGWYVDESVATPYVFTTIAAIDLTLIARWTINSYAITFVSNLGTPVDPISQNYSSNITPPQDPIRPGYTFAGWFIDIALTSPYVFTTMPATDLTLYAKWNIQTYQLTYQLNGGANGDNPSTYTIETPTITLSNPSRIGYTFSGWYDNANFTGNQIEEITLGSTGNIELFAKWTLVTYTIHYEMFGGSNSGNPTQYTIESNAISLVQPSREGYTFLGWYDNASLLGDPISSIPSGNVGNINLYAKWEINSYQLQFVSSLENTTIDTYFIDYQAIPALPIAPIVSGYTFIGWAYEGQLIDGNWTMPARDVTLEAMYTGNQSTIVFITDQGISTLSVQTGSPIGVLPTLALPNGYEFIGWSTTPDQADLIDASFIVPHNELIALYPIWIIINEPTNNMDLRQGTIEHLSWQQPLIEFFSIILVMTFLTTCGLILRAKQNDHESK